MIVFRDYVNCVDNMILSIMYYDKYRIYSMDINN
jgi:hypothetical protein